MGLQSWCSFFLRFKSNFQKLANDSRRKRHDTFEAARRIWKSWSTGVHTCFYVQFSKIESITFRICYIKTVGDIGLPKPTCCHLQTTHRIPSVSHLSQEHFDNTWGVQSRQNHIYKNFIIIFFILIKYYWLYIFFSTSNQK